LVKKKIEYKKSIGRKFGEEKIFANYFTERDG